MLLIDFVSIVILMRIFFVPLHKFSSILLSTKGRVAHTVHWGKNQWLNAPKDITA